MPGSALALTNSVCIIVYYITNQLKTSSPGYFIVAKFYIWAFGVSQFKIFRNFFRSSKQALAQWCVVITRIYHMVAGEPESVVPPDLVVVKLVQSFHHTLQDLSELEQSQPEIFERLGINGAYFRLTTHEISDEIIQSTVILRTSPTLTPRAGAPIAWCVRIFSERVIGRRPGGFALSGFGSRLECSAPFRLSNQASTWNNTC